MCRVLSGRLSPASSKSPFASASVCWEIRTKLLRGGRARRCLWSCLVGRPGWHGVRQTISTERCQDCAVRTGESEHLYIPAHTPLPSLTSRHPMDDRRVAATIVRLKHFAATLARRQQRKAPSRGRSCSHHATRPARSFSCSLMPPMPKSIIVAVLPAGLVSPNPSPHEVRERISVAFPQPSRSLHCPHHTRRPAPARAARGVGFEVM
ncbi:hypothetical protein C8Q77DRAFT_902081 [Trametes polyzona]|nr:hypothetical protein C8Q77DRAFT_902081 [Trametes polyzona]